MTDLRGRLLATVLVTLAIGACRAPRPKAADRPADSAPPPLRAPSDMPIDFIWQQHVTATWNGDSESFDAVLQKRGDELLLMGLSPMGTPGFVLELNAKRRLTLQNRTGRRLPFRPHYIIVDIQRAFFPWLDPPPENFSGVRSGTVEGLAIREVYRAARLQSRSFRRADAPEEGAVEIEYRDWSAGRDAPARVVLTNKALGYRLVIDTVSQQRLGSR